jgi:hypothetical protein
VHTVDERSLCSSCGASPIAAGSLTVEVLREGVHSGSASGIVPSSFRIMRSLLSRLEDEKTGKITLKELNVDIPTQRMQQAKATAAVMGDMASAMPDTSGMTEKKM